MNRTLTCLFAVVALSLATLTPSAFAIARIQDSPALASVLETLSEAAADGASLEYFGFSDTDRYAGDLRGCKAVTTAAIVRWFDQMTSQVLEAGGRTVSELPQLARARADLKVLLGKHRYLQCEESVSVRRSLQHRTWFVAQGASAQLLFELGYED